MTESIIHLDGLKKTFRDRWWRLVPALKGVSLSVQRGEAFGFIGPNGAGKSTTIKILTGVLEPSSGHASLFGLPVSNHRCRLGMAYVPENPYLYDYLTPLEVLGMGVTLHKLALPDARRHCLSWLDRFGIAHVANKRIRTFSKGMTQRVALAHALACQPKLLILDEPLSGLDPIGRKEVVDILDEYKHSGGSLFFSSHVLHDVERLADRFGLIHKGELRTVQTPSELLGGELGTVTVTSVGTQALPGAAPAGEGVWAQRCVREDLWQVLELAKAHGHQVLEVRSALSLEAAFLKFVEETPNDPSVPVEG